MIDTALAGQKVKNARDAGENAEKVAYEEYVALMGLGAKKGKEDSHNIKISSTQKNST